MKQNQRGFTVVEVLLVILVLSVVGFGAYFVITKNSDTKEGSDVTTTTSDREDTATNESAEPAQAAYDTTADGLRYQLPLTWTYDANHYGQGGNTLVSPNYKPHEAVYLESGATIRFGKSGANATGKSIAELTNVLKTEAGDYAGEFVRATIAGQEAIKDNSGHYGKSLRYTVKMPDGSYVFASMNGVEKAFDDYAGLFEDFAKELIELNK